MARSSGDRDGRATESRERAAASRAPGPVRRPLMPARPHALSEILAAETVSCLNQAMAVLQDIWDEIGIPEKQQLERTEAVKKHIEVRGAGGTGPARHWACGCSSLGSTPGPGCECGASPG